MSKLKIHIVRKSGFVIGLTTYDLAALLLGKAHKSPLSPSQLMKFLYTKKPHMYVALAFEAKASQ